jgi:hypothetical protein
MHDIFCRGGEKRVEMSSPLFPAQENIVDSMLRKAWMIEENIVAGRTEQGWQRL